MTTTTTTTELKVASPYVPIPGDLWILSSKLSCPVYCYLVVGQGRAPPSTKLDPDHWVGIMTLTYDKSATQPPKWRYHRFGIHQVQAWSGNPWMFLVRDTSPAPP